ncbi:MAG: hypothetical protein KatS3mg131_0979 [Candidatus Tectimicrobiota bacterium]|nr:MAG: hypothetical protein KatS3mg131_0979 [Candidatus Tectomicrobia bacterium]
MTAVKVGCCGFPVARHEYFRLFDLVEVQQTFYQPPRLETVRRWRETAPPGFTFTLKAWQLITHPPSSPTYRRLRQPLPPQARNAYGHFRPTPEVFAAWTRTLEIARALAAPLVVLQCPASLRPSAENVANLRAFFTRIPRDDLRLAWEPRGAWPPSLVAQLCQELDLIHCVDPFKDAPQHGEIYYFRLHGRTGYDYRYSDAELQAVLAQVGKRPAFVLFNNKAMLDDALRCKRLLATLS